MSLRLPFPLSLISILFPFIRFIPLFLLSPLLILLFLLLPSLFSSLHPFLLLLFILFLFINILLLLLLIMSPIVSVLDGEVFI